MKNENWNVIWNIPLNPHFETPYQVLKLLQDYSVIGRITNSEFKNHVGIEVPNHLVERAANAVVYHFGRKF